MPSIRTTYTKELVHWTRLHLVGLAQYRHYTQNGWT